VVAPLLFLLNEHAEQNMVYVNGLLVNITIAPSVGQHHCFGSKSNFVHLCILKMSLTLTFRHGVDATHPKSQLQL